MTQIQEQIAIESGGENRAPLLLKKGSAADDPFFSQLNQDIQMLRQMAYQNVTDVQRGVYA